ncbi:DUF4304 domain-containing protein [Mesorhizobium sp. LjRoot246]|uniref:DUF4304 domain-containing protein n=1 Tax=Mesorhizobium sp. LjRoot246 TaxID=3342294 RepID=UPI003F4F4D0B
MDKKGLEALLNRELSIHGFIKKSTSWYRQEIETLQIVNLQKSNFGLRFYINICCVPNGMSVEGMPRPKEHDCPIRIRLESAFIDQKATIEEAFNLEILNLSDDQRANVVSSIVSTMIVPFLENMKDKSSLIRSIKSRLLDHALITLTAKAFLGID